jgi:protein-S-isoprenylcysteine O-methyltransferase Ste14
MRFCEEMISLLNKMATGTKKTRLLFTPVGIIIFSLIITAILLAAIIVDNLMHLPRFVPEEARLLVSIPIMALGIVLTAWSVLYFFKAKGTPVPFNPPPQLVKTGPYRYSRNPMLTGVFVCLFGVGMWLNSVSLVFFFTPLFIIFIVWGVKQIEEPELIKRLGTDYIEYRKTTPMFLPNLKRGRK